MVLNKNTQRQLKDKQEEIDKVNKRERERERERKRDGEREGVREREREREKMRERNQTFQFTRKI